MANSGLVLDNNALTGVLTASSQELTMPVSQLLTSSPSERWRSLTNSAWVLLDKGALSAGDIAMLGGLTCGVNSTIRARMSTVDTTGAAGDVHDSGTVSNGDARFDVNYGMYLERLSASASWRYLRFDISDPDASFVEAGSIVDGLSELFTYNFVPGGTVQTTDRSRVEKAASGKAYVWPDNNFRSVALSYDFITSSQRYDLIERLDRQKGLRTNVLLMTNTASANMPRDSIFGLMQEISANTYGPIFDIFGKQFKIEERV